MINNNNYWNKIKNRLILVGYNLIKYNKNIRMNLTHSNLNPGSLNFNNHRINSLINYKRNNKMPMNR